ncbi:(Fe-S)-binding protein [Desulfuromonas versatilis]|uniref:(Fe-S)-binding protein n=1 Tax=Desulfuromonas versatilis TaxID=2802975 RepID=A0ABN6DVP0_9BACT|nr:4Fe-4S ferredoxin [Desulfuromonas versatilis]BCR03221.1 (Fe-S)-binding protein [Desulfuromonas versatilis]
MEKAQKPGPTGSAAWVEEIIREFWEQAAGNSLHSGTGEKAWAEPLVGFARGDDPQFARLKADIGPFYWTPEEIFRLSRPGLEITAGELSVVSYVLPQTEATRLDQRREDRYPAERWARSRYFGEMFNCELRLHLAARLSEAGFPAIAPERAAEFDYRHSKRFGLASNWSERHTAWVAGLGTFGLSDGLITRLGKAVRFGSVVARIDLPATVPPYTDHQAWCLWHARGTCGACIKRCPAEAISESGHDKAKCFRYIREVTTPYTSSKFGTGATPCGLCQVKIPCEARCPL